MCLFVAIFVCPAYARTFIVTKTADTNDGTCDADCSLREAITRANQGGGPDIIRFSALFNSQQTISLTLGTSLVITNPLRIDGTGARLLAISQAGNDRVFDVAAGSGNVFIQNVLITQGFALGGKGGGIRNAGTLSLTNVSVCFNSSDLAGGGIYSTGAITITGSTVCNNESRADSSTELSAGGIAIAGGTAAIYNSTISENRALDPLGQCGGVCVSAGTLSLMNTTIANNRATFGGGLVVLSFLNPVPVVNVINTVVSDNIQPPSTDDDIALVGFGFTFNSLGNNLIGENDQTLGFTNGVNGDRVGSPALLGPLQDNGGPTNTHALMFNSPAINAGNNCILTGTCGITGVLVVDQRNTVRPQGATVDIGAFEYVAPTAAGVSISGRVLSNNGRAISRAIITMIDGAGQIRTAYTNTFGYYSFSDIAAGQSVVVQVTARGYIFDPSSMFVDVQDQVTGLVFRAN